MSLADVRDAIQTFRLQLPVIGHRDDDGDALPGLRCLREEIKRDAELLSENKTASTNAPYLIAVWNELVHAHQPIAVCRMFSPARTAKAVKVDIVADNGATWVRVNTVKNTRLMMEFREMDSYLTSDDEDEDRPRAELDNSVLRMGRELLAAARANPVGLIVPKVTLRLTRLNPDDATDPRIAQTVQRLCHMGIDVQLGERSHVAPMPAPRKAPEPTTNINLDLTALIALVSDISHSPLPRTEAEAHARFVPSQSYLDCKRERVCQMDWEYSGQHSRALAAQVIQEMNKGILEAIRERAPTGVAFWTTSEARRRCLEIVSKIGGEKERQRADALLGEGKASVDAYWEHSRYPPGFLPIAPVGVYPSTTATVEGGTTFFDALARTCSGILSDVSVAKLTVHTVASMLAGASRGHTTLTTNRSGVRAVLKATPRVYSESAALWIFDPRSLSGSFN